jgi:hypothetical protein
MNSLVELPMKYWYLDVKQHINIYNDFLLCVLGEYEQNLCSGTSCQPCPSRLPSCVGIPDGDRPFPAHLLICCLTSKYQYFMGNSTNEFIYWIYGYFREGNILWFVFTNYLHEGFVWSYSCTLYWYIIQAKMAPVRTFPFIQYQQNTHFFHL